MSKIKDYLSMRLFEKKVPLFCAAFLLFATNTFSVTYPPIPTLKTTSFPSIHHYEIFINGGGAAPWLNNTGPIAMSSTITNTYDVRDQQRWGAVAGGGISRVFSPSRHVQVTVGPSAYFVDFDKIQGVESPMSNAGPNDTLDYRFFANSGSLFLESHVAFTASNWQPVLVLGVGNAWNRLYKYREVPTDPDGSASPATDVFHNNTISSFAFEVGASIRHQLFVDRKHDVTYRCSLDYRYFNFGAGKFEQSVLQTSNQVLGVGTLNTSAILLSLSAAFH